MTDKRRKTKGRTVRLKRLEELSAYLNGDNSSVVVHGVVLQRPLVCGFTFWDGEGFRTAYPSSKRGWLFNVNPTGSKAQPVQVHF